MLKGRKEILKEKDRRQSSLYKYSKYFLCAQTVLGRANKRVTGLSYYPLGRRPVYRETGDEREREGAASHTSKTRQWQWRGLGRESRGAGGGGGRCSPALPGATTEDKVPSSGCQVAAVLPGECWGPLCVFSAALAPSTSSKGIFNGPNKQGASLVL